MSYSIKFERHKDYKRFNLHNIIADVNRFGEFTIEFYEDVEEPVQAVIYENGEREIVHSDFDAVRMIYAGATLHIDRIPDIIQVLEEKLNAYQDYIKSLKGENNEKP